MKSIELVVANFIEVAENNGKGSEARAIMKENTAYPSLERKAQELEILTKPFLESFQESAGGKNELVESFKRNFNMSEAEARVAAGVDVGTRNSGFSWDAIKESK